MGTHRPTAAFTRFGVGRVSRSNIFAEVVLHVVGGKLSPCSVESPMAMKSPLFGMYILNTPWGCYRGFSFTTLLSLGFVVVVGLVQAAASLIWIFRAALCSWKFCYSGKNMAAIKQVMIRSIISHLNELWIKCSLHTVSMLFHLSQRENIHHISHRIMKMLYATLQRWRRKQHQ